MQAMILLDHKRYTFLTDAVLGTDSGTRTTACAGISDIETLPPLFSTAEGERRAFDRPLGQIEPFPCAFVDLKSRQRLTRLFRRINLIHIGILFEQLRDLSIAQFAHLAPD